MNLLRLSLNLLRRDWRAGEWRVLLVALVLAVGSIASLFSPCPSSKASTGVTAVSHRHLHPDYWVERVKMLALFST